MLLCKTTIVIISLLLEVHHKFEYTQYSTVDFDGNIHNDERIAVRDLENPVRIINDKEPRYIYSNHGRTILVIGNSTDVAGNFTYDRNDPRKMIDHSPSSVI